MKPQDSKIKDRVGVIDVIAHEAKTGEVILVMNESQSWDGSDEQLLALQERFNAYVSFLLDGEMAESHPELAGKRTRIEVRCTHMPTRARSNCSVSFMISSRSRKLSWKWSWEMSRAARKALRAVKSLKC